MKKNSTKNKVLGGMFWKLSERISSQGVSFIVSVILARLLSPSEYGIIAMMNIFIVFAHIFVASGLNSALVQKKDADDLDFSTVFYCTLSMSFLMYGIVFLAAPFIAEYYKMPEMCIYTRVFALTLIIQSYSTVQTAYIQRNMLFKKTFFASVIGSLLSGIIGITMAYSGFGVWSLVVQHISSVVITTFTVNRIIKWYPQWTFSWERAKPLMDFGFKILGSSLANTIYKEIRQLLIGLYYTPTDLALYNRGAHMPKLITRNLDTSLRTVMFPAMANHSDDLPRVKQILKRAIKNTSFNLYFALTLMAVASKPIVVLLLTEKWIASVEYMQIVCIALMFMTVSGNNIQALKAIGKSDEVLKLEVFKKPLFLIFVAAALPFGVKAVVLTSIVNAIYAMWMNIGPTQKHLNYGRKEQLKDLYPNILLAAVMAACTLPISWFPWNEFVILGVQIVVGTIIYFGIAHIFHFEAYEYLKKTLQELYHKRTRHNK